MRTNHSNLHCFLDSTTPTVRSRFLPKTCTSDLDVIWEVLNKDKIEYFDLRDLWDSYDEWSAYGVGSPIANGNDTVVQYYTPYLSAIQIYTTRNTSPRHVSDDFDGEWSSENESSKLSRSSSSSFDKYLDFEELGIGLEDHWLARERRGDLYLEHFEVDGPFGRVPLKDKIDSLALKYPGLKEFNSMDLSPASWMAIAWYPIYHIPPRRHPKELYASFLTYHTLSSSFQVLAENITEDDVDNNIHLALARKIKCKDKHDGITLPPFGLATYRMQPRIWLNPATMDYKVIFDLRNTADSWLKQLHVQHHDYNFFVSHPM